MAYCAICTPKSLPGHMLVAAAKRAMEINPLNAAPVHRLAALMPNAVPHPAAISVLTTKYWHTNGVRLTVGFLDGGAADLRARILSHMNAWSTRSNVSFVETVTDPQVRITRTENSGYWSYVGTDILSIPAGEPTMNLESFTMAMQDSEFHRVVRHETGHTLGCPHEHMRRELVEKIDSTKAIAYFAETQGWSELEVRQQVLTPIDESSLLGTAHADVESIMCYQIPGTITVDGEPIPGGADIDEQDYAFMEKVYPKPGPQVLVTSTTGTAVAAAPAASTDTADLRRTVAQLQSDNDVLKKAVGILARDQA
jgi:Astacin (Peptidase family M12A)